MKSKAAKVKSLVVQGFSRRQIAKKLGISEGELETDYARELKAARAEARAIVGGALFRSAMARSLSAIFFYLKTRAGWSETRYLKPHHPEPEQPDLDAPPKTFRSRIRLPCNARQGCSKAGPKQRLEVFKKIRADLIAEAARSNFSLDFERAKNPKLSDMWQIHGWAHGEKTEQDG